MSAGEAEESAREIELKLDLDPADAAKIRAHPALAGAMPQQLDLISTYFDTPDLALHRAGVYLRVRDENGRFIQTVKTGSASDLLERGEWETELQGREPDLDAVQGTPLAALLSPELRAALRPSFETRIRRTLYRVEHDGAEIEIALDDGEILSRSRHAPISELELELKRGDRRALFALARQLVAAAPLSLAVKTKAERGFALAAAEPPSAERALELDIPADMPSGAAFQTIARSCLRQAIVNAPGACEGNADALHQMRVGLRRLRASIAVFSDLVESPELDRIKDELKWIGRALAPARELDVLAADLIGPLKHAHPDDGTIAAAERALSDKRQQAYAQAAACIRSDRFRTDLLALAEWIECGAWRDSEAAQIPAAAHAKAALAKLRRRIKQKSAGLGHLSVQQKHKLRIRTKRLRYATEFFARTFTGEKAARRQAASLSALKDLQDALGGLNDLATHDAVLAERKDLISDQHKRSAKAESAKLLAKAEDAYARFADTKAFWKG